MEAISGFQPIGNSAADLRVIIPELDHMDAVRLLRTAEAERREIACGGYVIAYDANEMGWAVTWPEGK